MNIFKLRFAIYISLAVLALQKLSPTANITPNSNLPLESSTEDINSVNRDSTVTPIQVKADKPDQIKTQPFIGKKDSYSKQRQERRESVSAQKITLLPHPLTPTLSGIEVRDFIQTRLSNTGSQPPLLAARETVDGTTSPKFLATETLPITLPPLVAEQVPPASLRASLPSDNNVQDLQRIPTLNQSAMLPSSGDTPIKKRTVTPIPDKIVVARGASTQFQLEEVQPLAKGRRSYRVEQQESNETLTEPLTTDAHSPQPVTREAAVGTTSAASPVAETLPLTSLPSRVQQQAPRIAPTNLVAAVPSHNARDLQGVLALNQSAILPKSSNTPPDKKTINPQLSGAIVVQGASIPSHPDIEKLQNELRSVEEKRDRNPFQASPALSIAIPTGFGADHNTGFISASYQQRTRDVSGLDDGGLGVGIGLGDARKAVGVELSYATASFGNSRDFGAGGFNVKVHRRLLDDLAVAVGWNGFLNLGGRNDFEQSLYGVVTQVIRTRDDINLPFSRVAVSVGIGNGQFETENAVASGDNTVNVFGNVAVRLAQPVSLIAEWSGQDLGVGLSITPFKNIPLVITPAVRDLAGAGDEPRFVLGTGLAFRF